MGLKNKKKMDCPYERDIRRVMQANKISRDKALDLIASQAPPCSSNSELIKKTNEG